MAQEPERISHDRDAGESVSGTSALRVWWRFWPRKKALISPALNCLSTVDYLYIRGAMTKLMRIIKKYPNRRLYDTSSSRYVTLQDMKTLVMELVDFS